MVDNGEAPPMFWSLPPGRLRATHDPHPVSLAVGAPSAPPPSTPSPSAPPLTLGPAAVSATLQGSETVPPLQRAKNGARVRRLRPPVVHPAALPPVSEEPEVASDKSTDGSDDSEASEASTSSATSTVSLARQKAVSSKNSRVNQR